MNILGVILLVLFGVLIGYAICHNVKKVKAKKSEGQTGGGSQYGGAEKKGRL